MFHGQGIDVFAVASEILRRHAWASERGRRRREKKERRKMRGRRRRKVNRERR